MNRHPEGFVTVKAAVATALFVGFLAFQPAFAENATRTQTAAPETSQTSSGCTAAGPGKLGANGVSGDNSKRGGNGGNGGPGCDGSAAATTDAGPGKSSSKQ